MTTLVQSIPRHRLSWTRRTVGTVLCILSALLLIGYLLARLERANVFLRSHFENTLTGIGVLLVLAIVELIVLLPVRNSAVQGRRMAARLIIAGIAFFVLIAAGITHGFKIFTYHPTFVATSPDGTRRLALVDIGQYSELHTWVGSGAGTRLTGDLGAPCEFDSARFLNNSEVVVSTGFGDYDIHLDSSGRPLNVLTNTCPQ